MQRMLNPSTKQQSSTVQSDPSISGILMHPFHDPDVIPLQIGHPNVDIPKHASSLPFGFQQGSLG